MDKRKLSDERGGRQPEEYPMNIPTPQIQPAIPAEKPEQEIPEGGIPDFEEVAKRDILPPIAEA